MAMVNTRTVEFAQHVIHHVLNAQTVPPVHHALLTPTSKESTVNLLVTLVTTDPKEYAPSVCQDALYAIIQLLAKHARMDS